MEMKNKVLKVVTVTTLDGGIYLVGKDNEPPVVLKTALAASRAVKALLMMPESEAGPDEDKNVD